MKPNYESYSDYYQTEYELKLNKLNMDKVLNHKREEITLPDTLESLVAQLSIKAMQCIDSKNRERVFEFNDEEFEDCALLLVGSYIRRMNTASQEQQKY